MQRAHQRLRRISDACSALSFAVAVTVVSSPAWAVAGLDGLVSKIQTFNMALIGVGAALAVTGFIRVCLALIIGIGNAAGAVVMLAAGLAMAAAPQIVGFFTGAVV